MNNPLAKFQKYVVGYTKRLTNKNRFRSRTVPRLHVETTNICNSNCVFCANSKMTRKKVALDYDAFTRAVDHYAAMGGDSIDFNVTIGDPLLDRKILDRGRYVRKYPQFKSLGFVTTLQWLHKHDVDEFLRTFTWVSVSTSLSGREKYQEFFGVDEYDSMLRNIETLIGRMAVVNPSFALHLGMKPTNEPISAVISHPDFIRINGMVSQDLVHTIKNRSIFVDDWGIVDLPAYLKRRPLIPRWRRPCTMLYNVLHVHSNGKIAACACRDYNADSELIVGDIATDNIGDVWNGEALQKLRDNWRTENVVPKICQSCRFYQF